ncbi:hypothetical protein FHT70_003626 [Rhizobium sp. BK049]|nr:hypothetical protein [Rhizobium sp. BK049]
MAARRIDLLSFRLKSEAAVLLFAKAALARKS